MALQQHTMRAAKHAARSSEWRHCSLPVSIIMLSQSAACMACIAESLVVIADSTAVQVSGLMIIIISPLMTGSSRLVRKKGQAAGLRFLLAVKIARIQPHMPHHVLSFMFSLFYSLSIHVIKLRMSTYNKRRWWWSSSLIKVASS